MKRSVCAMLTAAAVVGCQSSGRGVVSHSYPPAGVGQMAPNAGKPLAMPMGTPLPGSSAQATPNAAMHENAVMAVGYNTGHGVMQNTQFGRQKVAAALPSHGGAMPGYPGMPPNAGMMGAPMAGGPVLGPRFVSGRTQIRFLEPAGMKIAWQSADPSGAGAAFTPPQLTTPDRYNFLQGQIYRLKLTDMPNRAGLDLYPTLEVYPGNAKVDAFLAHQAVPIEFTDEDFDQVKSGNYVTKVIYLPDSKYQELAVAGVETLVSTRLDPGVDPVQEAHRRGSILCVIRMGSVLLEMPHSPPLLPTGAMAPMMPPGMPGMMPPGMGAPVAPRK